ncbi:LamG-like jellyroll fold domain-containing protein [Paenibacillus cremeus]|uniref:Family 43 glycosylhydrolase n=1 Tax=Paenibacillus cremeus TaxID=2163881 RepID=A0A559KA01_9BACL|nr:LamG-like jellyroll fold domain-containing protein [Paenibacillus cremeus]TVY08961.1 family 43 glycosylhydrolase [Paenibacillus cremeus]
MLASSKHRQQAYLMGYFRSGPGQTHKVEELHYAYSRDGLRWYELNGNKPVWASSLGEGILRDPFIGRGPDGRWHLVFTIRPLGPAIGYASSADLIHWEAEKALPVMADIPDTVNSWAPEFSYDPVHGDFLIYWASSTGSDLSHSKHYCTRTKDWSTFSPTELFYDPGFQTIDASLAEHEGKFYMAIKDESHVYEPERYPHPPMNFLAAADRLEGPYEVIPGVQTPDFTEGPEFLWIESRKKWLLLYDYWAYGKFGVMESADMTHWSAELEEGMLRTPYRARHANVFPIGEEELRRLLDRYALLVHYRTTTYAPVRVAAEETTGFLHDAFALRSVVMELQPERLDGTQVLYDEGDAENGLALRLQDGVVEAVVCAKGRRCSLRGEHKPFTLGQWQHVVVTFGEGELRLFVDGEPAGCVSSAITLVHGHESPGGYGGRFGVDAFGDCGGKGAFLGAIRHVRIYSVPLQLEDIRWLRR